MKRDGVVEVSSVMARLSGRYERLLDGLMLVACLLLLGMAVMIGADVVSRNVEGFRESLLKKLVLEIAMPAGAEPAVATARER